MKARKDEILTTVLFCGFLSIMAVLYFVLPKRNFSETEKRYLEETPQFTAENLLSGQLGTEIESYMADHIPFRDFFVGLNAYYELASGRQITADIRVRSGNRLVEAPVADNPSAVRKNMQVIQSFADTVDVPVDLMIIPSAGWASEKRGFMGLDLFSREEYCDGQIIGEIYAMAQGNLYPVDILSTLEGKEDYYFKTDHHWNNEGAYEVYAAYMRMKNRAYSGREDFRVERVEGFFGSTYSRSALWLTPGEPLELWHSKSDLTVTNGETDEVHEGVFYPERLTEADKYTVYLDGNHSLVRIDNPDRIGMGKLLVVRDSYANLLGGFLAESYESVIMVDLRYYKNPVSELLAQEKIDEILICYSIGNFMTDANIVWLR